MLLPMKIRPPVWWHSYSKITVCLLILNIKLKYDQDLNMHNLACTQGAVAVTIVKHNITINKLFAYQIYQQMKQCLSLTKLETFPVCNPVSCLVEPCWQIHCKLYSLLNCFWNPNMYDLACSQEAAAIEIPQANISIRWSNSDRRFDEMLALFLDCFCCLSMFCEVRVTKPAQGPQRKHQTTGYIE